MEDRLIIVGGGPAALTASIYASRYGIKNIVLAESFGGEIAKAYQVENYPGFDPISGYDLSQKIKKHAESYDEAELVMSKVEKIERNENEIKIFANKEYSASAIILAHGLKRRKLNIPGEKDYEGKGVNYCTTCDAPLYRNKTVAVIGGANSAATSALLLSKYASKVYLIMIEKEMIAEKSWIEKVNEDPKITIINETGLESIEGDQIIRSVTLSKEYDGSKKLLLDGIFIVIGYEPDTKFSDMLGLPVDEAKKIVVGKYCETSISGVYAAGDICDKFGNFSQILTAEAAGAAAAFGAYQFLSKKA